MCGKLVRGNKGKVQKTSSDSCFQVCIVSEECAGSLSDVEPERYYNSPPPAYSSPIVPRYKKIPTDNETTQDCVV